MYTSLAIDGLSEDQRRSQSADKRVMQAIITFNSKIVVREARWDLMFPPHFQLTSTDYSTLSVPDPQL